MLLSVWPQVRFPLRVRWNRSVTCVRVHRMQQIGPLPDRECVRLRLKLRRRLRSCTMQKKCVVLWLILLCSRCRAMKRLVCADTRIPLFPLNSIVNRISRTLSWDGLSLRLVVVVPRCVMHLRRLVLKTQMT